MTDSTPATAVCCRERPEGGPDGPCTWPETDCHQNGPAVPIMEGYMREWTRHETAPRTPCPECHFESSEGYPPSHAPGCSQAQTQPIG